MEASELLSQDLTIEFTDPVVYSGSYGAYKRDPAPEAKPEDYGNYGGEFFQDVLWLMRIPLFASYLHLTTPSSRTHPSSPNLLHMK